MSIPTRFILVISTLFTIGVCTAAESVPDPFDHVKSVSDETPKTPADDPLLDLYGNEIIQAVARYKVDAAGTVYEEHSPETEVPRLSPPKS